MGDYTSTLIDRIQDVLAIPTWLIKPVLNIQWGHGSLAAPNPLALRVNLFKDTPSLYMNGLVFFGVQFPFFVNLMIRWGGADASPAYMQMHIGWRPVDGRPVIVWRFQSDDSAQGGLARGFEDGPK